jgi:IS30 family transposase
MRKPYHRVGFTSAQIIELWERWKRGEGLKAIGRVFGKPSSCIFNHIKPTGGIKPAARRRSRLALSLAEREEISRGLAVGRTLRAMAAALGRSPSTVSRVIARNGGSRHYRATTADKRAWKKALRPKPCKLATHSQLREIVATKLQRNWSPQQIAGWLKRAHPEDEEAQVSHETIYRSLYVQARGVLKKELQLYLRSHRPIRRSRHATQKGQERGQIPNAVSISQRPAETEDRAVPGYWEGDLICGSKNSNIVTLVERHSRYVMLAKVPNRETQTVITALIKQAHHLPHELYKSLTWDRGKELSDHQRFTIETDIAVYFCDPQSP